MGEANISNGKTREYVPFRQRISLHPGSHSKPKQKTLRMSGGCGKTLEHSSLGILNICVLNVLVLISKLNGNCNRVGSRAKLPIRGTVFMNASWEGFHDAPEPASPSAGSLGGQLHIGYDMICQKLPCFSSHHRPRIKIALYQSWLFSAYQKATPSQD